MGLGTGNNVFEAARKEQAAIWRIELQLFSNLFAEVWPSPEMIRGTQSGGLTRTVGRTQKGSLR